MCVGVMYSSRLTLKDTAVSGKFNMTQMNVAFSDFLLKVKQLFKESNAMVFHKTPLPLMLFTQFVGFIRRLISFMFKHSLTNSKKHAGLQLLCFNLDFKSKYI